MKKIDKQYAQYSMRHASWLALWIGTVSCRFDLPRVSSADAPGDTDVSPPLQYSSCMGLSLTCGGSGTGSCCEPAMTITGGTFLRGYDAATDAYNDMNYPATVNTFVLDKYEVTVGRFRKFVEAGKGTQGVPPAAGAGAHPRLPSSGWDSAWNTNLVADTAALKGAVKCYSAYQTWTDASGINENKPMNCVSWYEAMAFCIWDGGYLPTEAEWSYAAMGGGQQRAYPWSNPSGSTSIDCTYANYRPGVYCVNDPAGGVNRVGSESTKGDGRWGHLDLAGNVAEWMLDWYVSPYPDPQTCNDCVNLTASSTRVVSCGAFTDIASGLRVAFRRSFIPTDRGGDLGWRCARTP